MTNAPIPIPVDRVISAASLDPNPHDLMMAAGGVAFANPSSASDAYPHLWKTHKAARHAFARDKESGNGRNQGSVTTLVKNSTLTEVSFQQQGAGHSIEAAWVDLTIVPDPKAEIAKHLKEPLASFSFTNASNNALVQGSRLEQALAAMPGGLLSLNAAWLASHLNISTRSAERLAADYKPPKSPRCAPNRNIESLITKWGTPTHFLAVYKLAGQKRPSRVLVRHDVADPRAELSRLLGVEVVEFRPAEPEPTSQNPDEVAAAVVQSLGLFQKPNLLMRDLAAASMAMRSVPINRLIAQAAVLRVAGMGMWGIEPR